MSRLEELAFRTAFCAIQGQVPRPPRNIMAGVVLRLTVAAWAEFSRILRTYELRTGVQVLWQLQRLLQRFFIQSQCFPRSFVGLFV